MAATPLLSASRDVAWSPSVEDMQNAPRNEADVLIVGAGILGCALAVTFARQGRSVYLLERSLKEPDRIVGELLQPGGVQALETLGLRHCLEEIDAIPVKGYGIFYYDEFVEIPYLANDHPIEKPSPEGRSFHHGRFVRRLRKACLCEPNVKVVETTVTSTIKSPTTNRILGVEAMGQSEKPCRYFASLNVIADGHASKFRKQHHPHTVTTRSKFWGIELIDAKLPLPLHGHVVLGDGAPVLLYQIGTHETRALIDVPTNLPSASPAAGGIQNHLRTQVLPSLPKGVQSSFSSALDKGKLRSMPNSFLPPSTNVTPGLIMLGDAMNIRHPLTGGGMTVALNDVVLLHELLSPSSVPDLGDTSMVLEKMSLFHWRRKSLASVINILAQALYTLFAANGKRHLVLASLFFDVVLIDHVVDPYLRALQRGCFRYFQLGGTKVSGPVGLLAGITRQPVVLFYHFFAVALLAMKIFWQENIEWWNGPVILVQCLVVLWKSVVVIVPYIWSELRR